MQKIAVTLLLQDFRQVYIRTASSSRRIWQGRIIQNLFFKQCFLKSRQTFHCMYIVGSTCNNANFRCPLKLNICRCHIRLFRRLLLLRYILASLKFRRQQFREFWNHPGNIWLSGNALPRILYRPLLLTTAPWLRLEDRIIFNAVIVPGIRPLIVQAHVNQNCTVIMILAVCHYCSDNRRCAE